MINKVLSCFNILNIEAEIENFSRYYFKASATKGRVDLDNELYEEIKNYFKEYGYRWSLSIEDESYHIDQNNFQKLIISSTFSDTFEISLEVFKEGDTILILNENVFFCFLENLALQDLLMNFTNKETCVFQNPEYKNTISSSLIGYNQQASISGNSIKLSSQCYFYNYANFKFSPSSFCFKADDNQNDRLLNLFKKVYFVMILIYLFDISEIKDDKILFKVKGSKIFNYELEFKNIDISSLTEYEKIYNWVYSDNNKVEDKIGIVRNIITFYLELGTPTIDSIVYKSILNANELYIKGNVTKYLESRSKIFDQLEGITNKISSSLDTFFSNFQKSIYVFISFYLTVFILKILNNKSDITSALSKEATITGFALICISLGFLIFSLIILNLDKNRIIQKYDNLKNRFLDILDNQDILKILNDNKEFNSELENFKKRRNGYTTLWIITITILCTSLLLTSEWIRFNNKGNPTNKAEINKYPTTLKRDKVLIINSKAKSKT